MVYCGGALFPLGLVRDYERLCRIFHSPDHRPGVPITHVSPLRRLQLCVLGDPVFQASAAVGTLGVIHLQHSSHSDPTCCDRIPGKTSSETSAML